MTPKEKAKELVEQFTFRCEECNYDWNAKQCALIAVDEIISNTPYGFYSGIIPAYKGTDLDYWKQVKQEIEKL